LASDFKTRSINGFEIKYNFQKLGETTVNYNANPIQNLIKQPDLIVKPHDPLNSFVSYDPSLTDTADKIFDTMAMLYSQNEHCVAALFFDSSLKTHE